MMLLVVGVNHRTAPMELREAIAFNDDALTAALAGLNRQFDCEAVLVSTCNRVEVYLARLTEELGPDANAIAEFLARSHQLPFERLRPCIYSHRDREAVQHLFRVVGSLDSLVLGEGQIAGQVKDAYELAQQHGAVGPLLHALFQHARQVARRIRTETGVSQGKVSVASLALDYLAEVFDHFGDKTVLVIGAGKMGELTLRQLGKLRPQRILVTNRSPDKARQVAATCGGEPLAFEHLDDGLARADIILSTTGAAEPIVSLEHFQRIVPLRAGRPAAIIDIAVPRDFDARISELELVDLLVNVDDLQAIRERVLKSRLKHVPAAEAIVAAEAASFLKNWSRRQAGPAISRLNQEWDAIRAQVQAQCLSKLNGKLSDEDRAVIEGAFRLLQNKLMHTPIAVLREGAHEEGQRGLLDAVYKLFRLKE
jgi:glutamyl-tRNA reductase